jgi:hypothetical protein
VFCTAYAASLEVWDTRYRQWINALQASSLDYDQLLLIDDGSPVSPLWADLKTVASLRDDIRAASVVLQHFDCRLGNGPGPWLGWWRSFLYAALYAKRYGFERAIHVESDAFLVSERLCRHFNQIENEWVILWCPRHAFPESGIQVMAGTGLDLFAEYVKRPSSERLAKTAEWDLPRTRIEKGFVGDRYGEFLDNIPRDADYVMQANWTLYRTPGYLWWLPSSARLPEYELHCRQVDWTGQ